MGVGLGWDDGIVGGWNATIDLSYDGLVPQHLVKNDTCVISMAIYDQKFSKVKKLCCSCLLNLRPLL